MIISSIREALINTGKVGRDNLKDRINQTSKSKKWSSYETKEAIVPTVRKLERSKATDISSHSNTKTKRIQAFERFVKSKVFENNICGEWAQYEWIFVIFAVDFIIN